MRGSHDGQDTLFTYSGYEAFVPYHHPLRRVRRLVNQILADMDGTFSELYSRTGRPSIPPEQLLRALMIQILYSIRSERQLMEQMQYNLLFKWFVGLAIDDETWDPTTFSKNRDRLLNETVTREFFQAAVAKARAKRLLSDEHFSVDGSLIESYASLKSFRPKDGSGDGDRENFHGERRTNETHASETDPDARLYRKGNGKEARLYYTAHVLSENRNGLVCDLELTPATGRCETEAALVMLARQASVRRRRRTCGADKGYDTRAFVEGARNLSVTPHVAAKKKYGAIDGRTTRQTGYEVSQRKRKRIEQVFGWAKTIGGLRKLRHRGIETVRAVTTLTISAYNILRMANLGVADAG